MRFALALQPHEFFLNVHICPFLGFVHRQVYSLAHSGKVVWFFVACAVLAISWTVLWLMLLSTAAEGDVCVSTTPWTMSVFLTL